MTKSTGDAPLTMSVPEAGKKYFDLSRDSSYRAAERGEIPTIRVGRLLRVPVRAMERLLDGVERTEADAT
jgi:excisionase family DNA binding protein